MIKQLMYIGILSLMCACSPRQNSQAPSPPETVAAIKTKASPVTVYQDFAAQTEAVDAVEIRARVGGILERQAFKDGARVKEGDLLFVIDRQPFLAAQQQNQANLEQAKASYLNSRQNLERIRPLLADRAVSQQDVDAAVAKERADAAAIASLKAQLQQTQLNLGYTNIRAPRDGIMGKALIKSGGLVNASSTLLTTLYSVDPMYVNFTVSEQQLAEMQKHFDVRERSPLSFQIKFLNGNSYPYPAKLNFVAPAVDPKSGTLQMRLSVPNPDGALRSGQFVRVIAPVRQLQNAILVPQKAVQELQGKQSVFVIASGNKVMYRGITATVRMENDWVVEAGLQPGELVVVEGTSKIKPGTPVKPVIQQS